MGSDGKRWEEMELCFGTSSGMSHFGNLKVPDITFEVLSRSDLPNDARIRALAGRARCLLRHNFADCGNSEESLGMNINNKTVCGAQTI